MVAQIYSRIVLPRSIFVPDNAEPEKPTYRCPLCEVTSTIRPVLWTLDHWICECDACKKIFYAKVDYTGSVVSPGRAEKNRLLFKIVDTYPKYVPSRHESIPENIWSDYLEAYRCHEVGAFKATVVMCRRMMQNVLLDRGAKKKDAKGNWITLRKQINEALPERDYSLVRTVAEETKFLGDYGAHPQDDGVDKVNEGDSKEMLDFGNTILEIVYINPYKIQKRLEKRKSR